MRPLRLASLLCILAVSTRAGSATTDNRFTKSGGEITDKVTGLVWLAADTSAAVTWPSRACPATYRVPKAAELVSIVDYRIGASNGVTADPIFNLVYAAYWSNDQAGAGASNAWVVDFSGGGTSSTTQSSTLHLRCVR